MTIANLKNFIKTTESEIVKQLEGKLTEESNSESIVTITAMYNVKHIMKDYSTEKEMIEELLYLIMQSNKEMSNYAQSNDKDKVKLFSQFVDLYAHAVYALNQ